MYFSRADIDRNCHEMVSMNCFIGIKCYLDTTNPLSKRAHEDCMQANSSNLISNCGCLVLSYLAYDFNFKACGGVHKSAMIFIVILLTQ